MTAPSRRLLWGANILWALAVFLLCAMPGDELPDPRLDIPHLDKAVHFGMFFITSLLLALLLNLCYRVRRLHICLAAVVLALVYGGAIEWLQAHFFRRSGDGYDLLADLIGALAGCLCYPLVKRLFRWNNGKA